MELGIQGSVIMTLLDNLPFKIYGKRYFSFLKLAVITLEILKVFLVRTQRSHKIIADVVYILDLEKAFD